MSIYTLSKLETELLSNINKNELLSNNKNNKNNISTLKSIVERYVGTDWNNYIKINKEKYNRSKVLSNKYFDIYIITWDKYQKSYIHDHSDNGCLYMVMLGNLTESIYKKDSSKLYLYDKQILNKNKCEYIHNDFGFHSINNNSDSISVSLHIYSPPKYKTNYIHI